MNKDGDGFWLAKQGNYPLVKFVFIPVIKLLFYSFDFVTVNDSDKRDRIRGFLPGLLQFLFPLHPLLHHVFICPECGKFSYSAGFLEQIIFWNTAGV